MMAGGGDGWDSSSSHHPTGKQQPRHLPLQQFTLEMIPPHQHQQQQPLAAASVAAGGSGASTSLTLNKETGAYDLGDLDQALLMYWDSQDHAGSGQEQQRQTLNIFPSQPMHIAEPPSSSKGGSSLQGCSTSSGSKRSSTEPSMEVENSGSRGIDSGSIVPADQSGKNGKGAALKKEGNKKGATSANSAQDGPKAPDPKTLRRLAQNREAARKSRLRKKAYVQSLESSRMRLAQIEQELQRARGQGIFFGGVGDQTMPSGIVGISSEAAMFDMEHARWQEEHHRLLCQLRAAVQEESPENEVRLYVDHCLAHYDAFMGIKSVAAKTDVFHLVSGLWKTPAERCFMWMGGFRPSSLLKMIVRHIEPLTEQQMLAICGLQQSTQEMEDSLSQGLDGLYQSLSDTVASDALSCPSNMNIYMGQMVVAMNKLSSLESFVLQADSLRHQTIHRLNQVLTTRQVARCFLAIGEYFHRLRALSALWLNRPRQQ